MVTFVLVHGAWHGGWCWTRVRRRLQSLGHEVFTPTLTGLADKSHLLSPEVDLRMHVSDVVNLLQWEDLSDVVLCGHSYGGFVITGAADQEADRIDALVYLDAFVPADGQSAFDLFGPEARTATVELADAQGEGWRIPPPLSAEGFNVNPPDRAWVDRLMTPQPLATFSQPLALDGGAERVPRRRFVYASDWSVGPFGACFERLNEDPRWTTAQIDCGHDVMIDRPAELAADLLTAAGV